MMDVHTPKVRAQIERAQRCLANGYPPVPILRPDAPGTVERNGKVVRKSPGKEPHNALWARKEREVYGATARTVEGWARLRDIADHPGLGLACGRAAAADVDVYDPELADAIEALAIEHLGTTPLRRVGQPPKRLLVYQVEDGPLPKAQTPELLKGDLKAKVEVLGQGQQFVAFGVHPVTGLPFAWDGPTPETVPLDELPAVTQEQVELFVADAEHLLREAGYRTKAEIEAAARRPEPPQTGRKPNGNGAGDASPFKAVNTEAMRRIEAWVGELFPTARRQAVTGAWRVPSRDLGRQLEEDLSIAPGGIVDFGVHDQGDPRHGKRTPIDLVMEFGGAADASQAARWLAERLGMTLEIGARRRPSGGAAGPAEDHGPTEVSGAVGPIRLAGGELHRIVAEAAAALGAAATADPFHGFYRRGSLLVRTARLADEGELRRGWRAAREGRPRHRHGRRRRAAGRPDGSGAVGEVRRPTQRVGAGRRARRRWRRPSWRPPSSGPRSRS